MLGIDFNIITFGLVGGLAIYGFFLGENRLQMITFGMYIVLFALSQLPEGFFVEISEKGLFGLHPSPTDFQFLLTIVSLILFSAASFIRPEKGGKKIRAVLLGILTGLFVIAFGLAVIPPESKEILTTDYYLANLIYNVRYYILLILSVWLVLINFTPGKQSKRRRRKHGKNK